MAIDIVVVARKIIPGHTYFYCCVFDINLTTVQSTWLFLKYTVLSIIMKLGSVASVIT